MYRQMDGYPSGHGQELADFLAGRRVVNGFHAGDNGFAFNGPGCAAAAIVARFKDEIGGIYLYPAGTRDMGEEYVYTVTVNGTDMWLRVEETHGGYVLFDGNTGVFDGKALEQSEDA